MNGEIGMSINIKQLKLLRESLVSEREHRIFLLEEGSPDEEESAALISRINELTDKINDIDERLP